MKYNYNEMLEFCNSSNQRKLLKFLISGNSVADTSIEFSRKKTNIYRTLRIINKRMTDAGSGEHFVSKKVQPVGLNVKGTSTLYDADGNAKIQWVKTEKDKAEMLQNFSDAIQEIVENTVEPVKSKKMKFKELDKNTMTMYCIGDAHVGLLSWGKETGEDYDLNKTEDDLTAAMTMLVDRANNSEEAFIIDLGDYYHMNSHDMTTTAGTSVDVDGRFVKVIEVGLRLTIKLIDLALEKHKIVHWRSAIGNHDTYTSLYATTFIKAWFRNDKRVIVHDEPSVFMYHVFGKNLIGITHGHTAKAEKLGEIMSVDCKNEWSDSEHRYWYTGHVHHQSVKEFSNCVVETFNTLAGKDAWHASQGYRSKQSMKAVTLHKEYGEISRNTVNQSLIRNR